MHLRALTLVGIIISTVTGLSLGVLGYLHLYPKAPSHVADTLNAAVAEVAHNYVDEISEEQLLQYAIEGMMQGLDEHSDYLGPEAYNSLQATTTGRFGGIGIELGVVEDQFTVVAPMDDTPASKAGIKSGDYIKAVDGERTDEMRMRDIVNRLRGKPGSDVTLTIAREAEADKDYTLERAIIRIASVRSRLLAPDFGYLRISQFQANTGSDVASHVASLTEDNGGQLAGLVLDLRNNPGGTLQSSVEVADHFLQQGLIVSTAGRQPISEASYEATEGDILAGQPIVVLINGGSASASEIVAAALKDSDRATVLGTTSYGKGSVQSVVPLADDQALKLTTAYYYGPNGETIDKVGVAPDIKADLDEELLLDRAVELLRSLGQEQLQARLSAND